MSEPESTAKLHVLPDPEHAPITPATPTSISPRAFGADAACRKVTA